MRSVWTTSLVLGQFSTMTKHFTNHTRDIYRHRIAARNARMQRFYENLYSLLNGTQK